MIFIKHTHCNVLKINSKITLDLWRGGGEMKKGKCYTLLFVTLTKISYLKYEHHLWSILEKNQIIF